MRITTFVLVGLSTLAPLGFSSPGYADPLPARRVVGQSLSSTQAVLFDEDSGEYKVVRVGDELNGSRVVAITAEDVLLVRGGTEELLRLAPDPRPRPRTVMEPLVINIKPMNLAPLVAVTAPTPLIPAPIIIAAPPQGSAPVVVSVPKNGTVVVQPPETVTAPVAAPVAVSAPAFAPATVPAAPSPSLVPAPAPVLVPSITPITRAELARGLGDFQTLDASVAIEVASPVGFRVAELRPGSFLNRMGLQKGDVILSVDGRTLRTAEDASAAYNWVRVADHFVVELVRDGQPLTLRFRVAL